MKFDLLATSGSARRGRLQVAHGTIESPFFMPVGTLAAVKGLTATDLRACGAQIVLANTYHLALRPGEDVVRDLGGLAAFMGWHGPTLTDSGGYQAFSLAKMLTRSEDGYHFQNHINGAAFFLSPERAVAIQQALGPDMFMALDECPPADATYDQVAVSIERTARWAQRCQNAWTTRDSQNLFGIVQGGLFEDLRTVSAQQIAALGLPGNAIGGVSVGESPEDMERIVAHTAPLLPADKPRYLMGVGRPEDLIRAIGHGVDMFDCVMPSRHARHAQAFTRTGRVNLKNQQYTRDPGPIEDGCDCLACRTVSRAYLRHLFVAGELLGPVLVTQHNLRHYFTLMAEARAAIEADHFATWATERLSALADSV